MLGSVLFLFLSQYTWKSYGNNIQVPGFSRWSGKSVGELEHEGSHENLTKNALESLGVTLLYPCPLFAGISVVSEVWTHLLPD